MKNTKLYKSFIKLIGTLKPMTWKQRIAHIWTYYSIHMVIALMLIILLIAIISSAISANMETLISGVLANIDMTEEGWEYIDEAYLAHLDGDSKKQSVNLTSAFFKDINTSAENLDNNYNAAMSAISMVNAQALDYFLMNEEAMVLYMTQEVFLDLTAFFTEEEIAELGDKVIYLEITDENDTTVSRTPVAVNIEEMKFAQDCLNISEGCYFALAVNTPRIDTCRDFWEYLLAWGNNA